MKPTAPRLHRPLLSAVETGLNEVLNSGKPADQFLAGIGKNRRFGGRDRRFIASNLYDILRFRRLFESVAEQTRPSGIPLYSYYILLNLVRQYGEAPGAVELYPSWSGLEPRCRDLLVNPGGDGRIALSYPDWLWEAGQADYGESWPGIAAALNAQAPVYLRANRLRTTAAALREALAKDGIATESAGLPDALILPGREPLMRHRLYEAGHFEFQDLASQHVAALSDIRPGMAVADACAGAGGKALHAASLMNNEGVVYASDRYTHRLKQLRFRAGRAGATCIDIIEEATMVSLQGAVHRLLLDVPCSATGTIWRKPEIKWQVNPASLKSLIATQREILDRYAPIVAPGGLLTYATCSILKSEGEAQAERFLAGHPEFSPVSEQRLLPDTDRTDGFYIAVFRRD